MSGRSGNHTQAEDGRQRARQPLAPKPTLGRHLRRILRAAKRRENGDFTALCLAAPIDTALRRLQRRASRHHATRNSAV